jgi:hypothetical protein
MAGRAAWSRALHLVDSVKPLFITALLLLTIVISVNILRRGSPPARILLPISVFLLQAAAYAYYLHPEDRYTYICNPLLFIQFALFLGLQQKRMDKSPKSLLA